MISNKVSDFLGEYEKGQTAFHGIDLRGESFRGLDLAKVEFIDAKLAGADFSRTNLAKADFSRADIRGANFSNAYCQEACFNSAVAGLQPRLIAVWIALAGGASVLSVSFSILLGLIITFFVFDGSSRLSELIFGAFGASTLLISFVILTIRRGILEAVVLESILSSFLAAIAMLGPSPSRGPEAGAGAAALIGACVGITVTVAIAIAVAIAVCTGRGGIRIIKTIAILTSAIGAGLGAFSALGIGMERLEFEDFDTFGQAYPVVMIIASAIAVLGIYVGTHGFFYEDERYSWVRTIALSFATTGGTCFYKADLTKSQFVKANIQNTNFKEATLRWVDWNSASGLHFAWYNDIYFNVKKVRQLVVRKRAYKNDFSQLSMQKLNLRDAELVGTTFKDADLNGTDLSNSNLCGANLKNAQVVETDFNKATLTGACLENWNISNTTNLQDVTCEFVYLKEENNEFKERRPSSGTFKAGEFTALFQKALDTVDLIFINSIDWKAFFLSFQELRKQYDDQDISIQSIEKKSSGAFILRLNVSVETDKSIIESRAKELYETELKNRLYSTSQSVEAEQRKSIELLEIVKIMASSQQGPKYDMRGAKFSGGFAEVVQGDQIGGAQYNYDAPEEQNLIEATLKIQQLLELLEEINPTATKIEQKEFVSAATPPILKQRAVRALQYGGKAALEELLDNPYVNIALAVIEGWRDAESFAS